jgi:hypothetical protein
LTFIAREMIEGAAATLWRTHHLEPAFDVELLLDELNLGLVWESIEDPVGHKLLAQLEPGSAMVVLNERHLAELEAKGGRLRRFTLSHEIGHWHIHAEAIRSGTLSLFDGERIWCPEGSRKQPEIQADIFASALLIPEDRLRPLLPATPWQGWPVVYRLADHFLVSVSAMRVRLETLKLMHLNQDQTPHSGAAPVPGTLDLPL